MEKEMFLQNAWDGDRNGSNELIGIEEANSYLDELRRDENEVPGDLTAEELVEFWNNNILAKYEYVVLPNGGRTVPRWCAMSHRQIAQVINEAETWTEVYDLCKYVLNNSIEEKIDESDPYVAEKNQDLIIEWIKFNL